MSGSELKSLTSCVTLITLGLYFLTWKMKPKIYLTCSFLVRVKWGNLSRYKFNKKLLERWRTKDRMQPFSSSLVHSTHIEVFCTGGIHLLGAEIEYLELAIIISNINHALLTMFVLFWIEKIHSKLAESYIPRDMGAQIWM